MPRYVVDFGEFEMSPSAHKEMSDDIQKTTLDFLLGLDFENTGVWGRWPIWAGGIFGDDWRDIQNRSERFDKVLAKSSTNRCVVDLGSMKLSSTKSKELSGRIQGVAMKHFLGLYPEKDVTLFRPGHLDGLWPVRDLEMGKRMSAEIGKLNEMLG
jgi:hypothetical protein